MKKLFILIFAVTFTACNTPADQVGAGFFTKQEGEKFVVASDEITDIWVKYIDAPVSYTHLTLPTKRIV